MTRDDIVTVRHAVLRPNLPIQTAYYEEDDRPGVFHIAERDDGAVVACASFYPEPLDGEPAWRLRGMATLEAYRNRGISRLLAVFANRWLVALGYTEVTFTVDAANIASIRMTLHKGCRALFSVSYVRILRWERLRVSKDVPQHLATYPGPTQRR